MRRWSISSKNYRLKKQSGYVDSQKLSCAWNHMHIRFVSRNIGNCLISEIQSAIFEGRLTTCVLYQVSFFPMQVGIPGQGHQLSGNKIQQHCGIITHSDRPEPHNNNNNKPPTSSPYGCIMGQLTHFGPRHLCLVVTARSSVAGVDC